MPNYILLSTFSSLSPILTDAEIFSFLYHQFTAARISATGIGASCLFSIADRY